MTRELVQLSLPDPEVLRAQDATIKLLREFKSCQDSLTKKAVKEMVYNALDRETELRLRSKAQDEVKKLHDLQKPNIIPN